MKQTYFEFWIPRNQHWGFLWFSLFRGTQHRQYSYHGNISTPVLMGLGSLGSLGSLSSLSRGGPHNGCSGCSGGTLRLRPRWCRSRRWRSRWSGASGASCCSWRLRSQESWSRRSRSRRSRSARRPLMLKWKLSIHSHGKHNIKVSKVSRYINQWIKMSLFVAHRDSWLVFTTAPRHLSSASVSEVFHSTSFEPPPANGFFFWRGWSNFRVTCVRVLIRSAFVKASNLFDKLQCPFMSVYQKGIPNLQTNLFISFSTVEVPSLRFFSMRTRPLGRARTFWFWLCRLSVVSLKMSVQDLKAQRFCCLTATDRKNRCNMVTAELNTCKLRGFSKLMKGYERQLKE